MSSTQRQQESLINDQRGDFTDHYINISSANRDKASDPSSNDSTYVIDGIKDTLSVEIMNFEIPHTRYAIDEANNTLYISEKISEGVYYFFGLKASTGGYTVSNLGVSLELSTLSPVQYVADTVLTNTYTFSTSASFGKVVIISSGDVEYNIHTCIETLTLVSYTKVSDTEAEVSFLAPYDYILAPGAMLTMNIYDKPDREVQVIETLGPRTVILIGDFSDIEDVVPTKSFLIPYSASNSVALVAGFGLTDLEVSRDSKFPVLAFGSPFALEIADETARPMLLTDFPAFLSTGDNAIVSGTNSFFEGTVLPVGQTHDATHVQLEIDVNELWGGNDITVSPVDEVSVSWDVTNITFISSLANLVTLQITPAVTTTLSVGDEVTFFGFTHASEWEDFTVTVSSVDISSESFNVQFLYATKNSFTAGSTFLQSVNTTSGVPTTFIAPDRFDLSRGRRVIICRMTIDGSDIGTLSIPNDPTVYFGRIQLFSGGDKVNFVRSDSAIGKYRFSGRVKHLRTIRLRFVDEQGKTYDFAGTDYSLFLKVKSALGYVV